jgi:bifunctional enzyme CysN/CysC
MAERACAEEGEPRARADYEEFFSPATGGALPAPIPDSPSPQELEGIVHILTCGSVDDGKSTLIGRLLWDASDLPSDQREMVRAAARSAGHPERLDYSMLLDGLVAEREQGITIDIAWRYLDTKTRRFVLIDSPGHDQYTRNMASGASHADAAVMLIDARHGLKAQTRRHAAILHLMGVTRVVLAVNKMDLVDWSEACFREIERDFTEAVNRLGFAEAFAIPVSARHGDNIATPSKRMSWYRGRTLVAHLEGVPSRRSAGGRAFRMPVQTVLRDSHDFRGLAGTISSGSIRTGDEVIDVTTGLSARVARITTMDGDLDRATTGMAVAMVLDTDLDITRGAVLAAPWALPVKARNVEAHLVWLASRSSETAHGMLLRSATDLVPVAAIEITAHVDLDTLCMTTASQCSMNDIAAASIALARATALDPFGELGETGAFLLVDSLTGATLAAGIVVAARAGEEARTNPHASFLVTRDMLRQGLCSDLRDTEAGTREFQRRAREVARLFEAAGVTAVFEGAEPASGMAA